MAVGGYIKPSNQDPKGTNYNTPPIYTPTVQLLKSHRTNQNRTVIVLLSPELPLITKGRSTLVSLHLCHFTNHQKQINTNITSLIIITKNKSALMTLHLKTLLSVPTFIHPQMSHEGSQFYMLLSLFCVHTFQDFTTPLFCNHS